MEQPYQDKSYRPKQGLAHPTQMSPAHNCSSAGKSTPVSQTHQTKMSNIRDSLPTPCASQTNQPSNPSQKNSDSPRSACDNDAVSSSSRGRLNDLLEPDDDENSSYQFQNKKDPHDEEESDGESCSDVDESCPPSPDKQQHLQLDKPNITNTNNFGLDLVGQSPIDVDADEDPEDQGTTDANNQNDTNQVKNNGAAEIDFEKFDFHPQEQKPPPQFSYCFYFENMRHTLNILLKKPIKKPFATNSKKIIIQVNQYDSAVDYSHKVHWDNDRFAPGKVEHLADGAGELTSTRGVSMRGNHYGLDRYGLVPFLRADYSLKFREFYEPPKKNCMPHFVLRKTGGNKNKQQYNNNNNLNNNNNIRQSQSRKCIRPQRQSNNNNNNASQQNNNNNCNNQSNNNNGQKSNNVVQKPTNNNSANNNNQNNGAKVLTLPTTGASKQNDANSKGNQSSDVKRRSAARQQISSSTISKGGTGILPSPHQQKNLIRDAAGIKKTPLLKTKNYPEKIESRISQQKLTRSSNTNNNNTNPNTNNRDADTTTTATTGGDFQTELNMQQHPGIIYDFLSRAGVNMNSFNGNGMPMGMQGAYDAMNPAQSFMTQPDLYARELQNSLYQTKKQFPGVKLDVLYDTIQQATLKSSSKGDQILKRIEAELQNRRNSSEFLISQQKYSTGPGQQSQYAPMPLNQQYIQDQKLARRVQQSYGALSSGMNDGFMHNFFKRETETIGQIVDKHNTPQVISTKYDSLNNPQLSNKDPLRGQSRTRIIGTGFQKYLSKKNFDLEQRRSQGGQVVVAPSGPVNLDMFTQLQFNQQCLVGSQSPPTNCSNKGNPNALIACQQTQGLGSTSLSLQNSQDPVPAHEAAQQLASIERTSHTNYFPVIKHKSSPRSLSKIRPSQGSLSCLGRFEQKGGQVNVHALTALQQQPTTSMPNQNNTTTTTTILNKNGPSSHPHAHAQIIVSQTSSNQQVPYHTQGSIQLVNVPVIVQHGKNQSMSTTNTSSLQGQSNVNVINSSGNNNNTATIHHQQQSSNCSNNQQQHVHHTANFFNHQGSTPLPQNQPQPQFNTTGGKAIFMQANNQTPATCSKAQSAKSGKQMGNRSAKNREPLDRGG